MKIQNALVSNILNRSQWYYAHVTTVTLSWRVQNINVIGRVYFTLKCFEFSSNFEFDRNMLSGTGASTKAVESYLFCNNPLICFGITKRDERNMEWNTHKTNKSKKQQKISTFKKNTTIKWAVWYVYIWTINSGTKVRSSKLNFCGVEFILRNIEIHVHFYF